MKIYLLAVLIVLFAAIVILSAWEEPSHIVAIGSLLSATVSSIALIYNVDAHRKAISKEAKLEFISFLPSTKQVLAIDIKQIVSSCSGTMHFIKLHEGKLSQPELFVTAVVNDDSVCELILDDIRTGNPITVAAINSFRERYENLCKEAKEFDAEFYFNVLIAELGFSSLLKRLSI